MQIPEVTSYKVRINEEYIHNTVSPGGGHSHRRAVSTSASMKSQELLLQMHSQNVKIG
jgi:hypothetical protein